MHHDTFDFEDNRRRHMTGWDNVHEPNTDRRDRMITRGRRDRHRGQDRLTQKQANTES